MVEGDWILGVSAWWIHKRDSVKRFNTQLVEGWQMAISW